MNLSVSKRGNNRTEFVASKPVDILLYEQIPNDLTGGISQ
jgi:hypothetical protein